MNALQIAIVLSAAILAIFFKAHGSFFSRRRKLHRKNIKEARKKLSMFRCLKGASVNPSILNYLKKINPFVFEELVLTALKDMGAKIKRNSRYTGDGGVDGIFWLNGHKFLIQAKRYPGFIVAEHIIEFSKVCNGHRGIFIHTGRTGKKAKSVVPQNITIISGNRLTNLILGKLDKEQIDSLFFLG